MNLGMRFGPVRPFVALNTRENNNYNGLQIGLTTFATNEDGDETYATSYAEWGGRVDHVYDLVCGPAGFEPEERLVATAGDDIAYVGKPVVTKDKTSEPTALKVA
jgi:hypothetical protein